MSFGVRQTRKITGLEGDNSKCSSLPYRGLASNSLPVPDNSKAVRRGLRFDHPNKDGNIHHLGTVSA